MPRYMLNLHDGAPTPAAVECLDLDHDGDALDLAQIALLSTARYTHAEIYRGTSLIAAIERDSYIAFKIKRDSHPTN